MGLSIMVQGTASDVGKSVLVAGLCRIFHQDGYRVAPFKSQNMALNSGITADGGEMGRAQIFQAEAAGIEPDVRMNPVLLKPTSDLRAQVVLMGKVANQMDAVTYHEFKPQLLEQIAQVYRSLADEVDIMVLEGAGSPAEINLRDRDIVNMGMAEKVDVPVILVADIDRGGVFASIYGTLALLEPAEKARVKGVIINKFRGDVSLLTSGLRQIEELTGVPIIGVMPWIEVQLEDEDGVALQKGKYRHQDENLLDIAVIQTPYISNFTDFNALNAQPDVRLRYVSHHDELGYPDLLILPGSKNTLSDLSYLHKSGLTHQILLAHQQGTPVLGICGGFQMLGNHIVDGVESGVEQMAGLGLLDCETTFSQQKVTTQVSGEIRPDLAGVFAACQEHSLVGYEIHMGHTELGEQAQPFSVLHKRNGESINQCDGAIHLDGSVAGTYIHGFFDSDGLTRSLLNSLRERKGLEPLLGVEFHYQAFREQQFDRLAAAMRENIDIEAVYAIMRDHVATQEKPQ